MKKLILLYLILYFPLKLNAQHWHIQTVDSAGDFWTSVLTSIAIDSNGYPHIAYTDSTNYSLKYAKWTGDSWATQTVDYLQDHVVWATSIALDSDGTPHITYATSFHELKYAKWTGTSWSTQTVDLEGYGLVSIALDSAANPHIAYSDSPNYNLKYAKWTGVSWTTQTVDSKGFLGGDRSIALDSAGNPHISYYDLTNGDLKYAKWTGTSWSTQTVDSEGDVGNYNSIALDSVGNSHISYLDNTNGDLKYAKWIGTSWSTQTVDSIGVVGWNTSIVIDANGYIHIAYQEDSDIEENHTGHLKYAKWTGVSWTTQTVDYEDYVGYNNSIALDSNGNPHISYNDYLNGDLKYARWINHNPTLNWTGETNYISDGLNPETGRPDTSFVFKIKYTDSDNDPPATGYPKVHILKNGVEIPGSPFTMNYVSGSYYSGAIYTYTKVLSSTGTDYTYYFEAKDSYGAMATGIPTNLIDAPDVINNAPVLSWTGETNYVSDGLNPETGRPDTNFVFRIKYTDSDNDPPASGYPKVHILKGGVEIHGSPFTMSYVSGSYDTGAIYSYTTTVLTSTGTDYTYYFETKDSYGATATGTPTNSIDAPDVMNNAPVLSWTGETNYTLDGLNPETGRPDTSFVFRVKYTDSDNDSPAAGYPKVHILKNGIEITGSPFTMSEVDSGDMNYADGKLYTYTKVLTSTGTDYSYYFEAQDSYGATAAGIPTNSIDAPNVINNAPVLSWTGETNYVSDGLNPETGRPDTSFVFRVKYSDSDNDPPASGYPKVHILKNGVEIAGSPFTMSEVDSNDVNYTDGKLYTYTKVLTSTGTDYTYYFEAKDSYNATATGTPTNPIDAPDVINNAPVLSWTEEVGYENDGLNPETGRPDTSFVFRIKYTDSDNDPPASGYPKLHIKKNGVEITGSPFTMSEVDSGDMNYADGKLYTYTKVLTSTGTDYSYYFEAQDSYGVIAKGVPTNPVDAPDVINNAPVLSWTGETNYVSDGLHPETGDRNTNFVFRIKYTDSDNDPPATGYPKLHIKKNGVEITGSPFSMSEVDSNDVNYTDGKLYTYTKVLTSTGTDYTYYFEVKDTYGLDGTPTNSIDAPDVINNTPVLSWTGETNYISDGLHPEIGDRSTNFIFRIKYTDANNDPPASGYPKVHIKKGGSEITGSPFSMTYVSGNYDTGAIYSYSTTLPLGTDYTYYFETKDYYGVDGVPTSPIDAPDVINNAPVLSWTGETGYENDGINPETGNEFVFKIKYTDADNDAPLTGYPKLHIKKSGIEIPGSPFTMNFVSGSYNTGAIYSYTTSLPSGVDSYYFEAYDIYGVSATGEPTMDKSGVIVIVSPPENNEVKVYHNVFKPDKSEKVYVSFNPQNSGNITVKVYSTNGKLIKTLYDGNTPPGLKTITWDGTDSSGSKVSSGVYMIRIEGAGIKQQKNVVVIR